MLHYECANVDMDVVFNTVKTVTFYDYVHHLMLHPSDAVISEYCISSDSKNRLQDFSYNNTFYL